MSRPHEERSAHQDPQDPQVPGINNVQLPLSKPLPPSEPVKAPRPTTNHDPGTNRLIYGPFKPSLGFHQPFEFVNSTTISNFRQMDYLISESERLLLSSQNYVSEKGNRLSVYMVKYYYFTLGYYTVFRSMIRNQLATHDQKRFVSDFEDMFDVKNLPVDGTMAPFFLALSSCDTTAKHHFNQVAYHIPVDINVMYNWDNLVFYNDLMTLLPNIPLLLRAIRRQRTGRYVENGQRRFENPEWNLTTDLIGSGQDRQGALPQVPPGTGPQTTKYLRLQPGFTVDNPQVPNPMDFAKNRFPDWPAKTNPNKPSLT